MAFDLAFFLLFSVVLAKAASPTDCVQNELRPNPNNPHTFYSCTPYGPVLMQCPGDLLFCVKTAQCEWEDHTMEPDPEISTQATEEPSTVAQQSSTEVPIEVTTLPTSTWPPTTTRKVTTTTTRVPTTTTRATTTQATTTTEATTTTTRVPTTTTRATTTTTKATTTTRVPTTTTRTTTQATTTTRVPTTTRSQTIICEPGRQFYPHPTTCSKFYQCSNGIPYLKDCGQLNFNPRINVCDWPFNYPCPL